jgi:hypothetical protein
MVFVKDKSLAFKRNVRKYDVSLRHRGTWSVAQPEIRKV